MTEMGDIFLALRKWEVKPLLQSQGEINQVLRAAVQRAQPVEVVVAAIFEYLLRGPFQTTLM